LNVHGINNGRQPGIHAAGPLVPEPSPFGFETVIGKMKRYKSPGSDQIPAELIQSGETLRNPYINWFNLPPQWKVSVCLFKRTVVFLTLLMFCLFMGYLTKLSEAILYSAGWMNNK
jgi:hypothetical protein